MCVAGQIAVDAEGALVGLAALFRPEFRVEVDAVLALPD